MIDCGYVAIVIILKNDSDSECLTRMSKLLQCNIRLEGPKIVRHDESCGCFKRYVDCWWVRCNCNNFENECVTQSGLHGCRNFSNAMSGSKDQKLSGTMNLAAVLNVTLTDGGSVATVIILKNECVTQSVLHGCRNFSNAISGSKDQKLSGTMSLQVVSNVTLSNRHRVHYSQT